MDTLTPILAALAIAAAVYAVVRYIRTRHANRRRDAFKAAMATVPDKIAADFAELAKRPLVAFPTSREAADRLGQARGSNGAGPADPQ